MQKWFCLFGCGHTKMWQILSPPKGFLVFHMVEKLLQIYWLDSNFHHGDKDILTTCQKDNISAVQSRHHLGVMFCSTKFRTIVSIYSAETFPVVHKRHPRNISDWSLNSEYPRWYFFLFVCYIVNSLSLKP